MSSYDFVTSYLYLYQIRFGDALVFNINLNEDTYQFMVPPLSVQMAVENSVKHNIISKKLPLHLSISKEHDSLVIENNHQPKSKVEFTSGIGLNNLRDRYALVGDEKQIEVLSNDESFIVKLPLIKNG